MTAIRKLSGNFVATNVDDEVLIVDLDGGELFSLTGTARAVWDAIDGNFDEAEIAERMTAIHSGNAATIKTDVAALIGELEQAALVERLEL